MHFSAYFTAIVSAISALGVHAAPYGTPEGGYQDRVLYFLDNNPMGSCIIAVQVSRDGTLASGPVLTSTGGKGALTQSAPGVPSAADTLSSQGSVVVSGEYLFTVNAGSDTVSMFQIDPRNPLHPTLVGEPAATLGNFPQSVAYSAALSKACVINGGLINGVTCFKVDPKNGLSTVDPSPRTLVNTHEINTPLAPSGSVTQVIFSPSSKFLLAITKGNLTAVPPVPGTLYTFPIRNGEVSRKPVLSTIPGLILDFGSVFLGSDDRMMMTNGTDGGAVLNINSELDVTLESNIVLANFSGACWAAVSDGTAYLVDANIPQIAAMDTTDYSITGVITYPSSIIGGLDTVSDGKRLYVLAKLSSTIVVIDIATGMPTHTQDTHLLDLSALGSPAQWQGMALWPAPGS